MQKKLKRFFAYTLPKLEDILFIAILFACLLLGFRMLSIDSDLGRHLTIGNYILETKNIPTRDILSYTKSGESRPPYEWLSQILFATVNKITGLDGIILLSGIVIAMSFVFIYKETMKISQLPIASMGILIIGLAASSVHWLPRPHLFTFFMLHIWSTQLERNRKSENTKIWHMPFIMLVWANLHGGFIFGFIVWFAYLAGDLWEKFVLNKNSNLATLIKTGILSLLASIITPDGWGNWLAVLGNNSAYILQNTSETMSPDFHQTGMLPFLFFLGLTIAIPTVTHTKLSASQIFLMTGMAMASLLVARNIPLFIIVTIPVLCECLTSFNFGRFWLDLEKRIYELQSSIKSYWIPIITILLSTAIIIKYQTHQISIFAFNPFVFPVQAVNWLIENPQTGNIFNEFNWGGYLEYKLYPQQKIFLDSQTDFYGEALMREYSQVIAAEPEWEIILQKYDVEWLLIHKNSTLDNILQSNQFWELIYQDETAAIYRKTK